MIIKQLGLTDYNHVFMAMKSFTKERELEQEDEIWLTEHHPVYTQGIAGKDEHILNRNNIPVIQTDRGGQVTYHGPGQAVMYPLITLKKYDLPVRRLITLLENTVILYLEKYAVKAVSKPEAPGVYVEGKKIASLGIRVKRGCVYHGLSLNVDMDLRPFLDINPCGYEGLQMTQCADLGIQASTHDVLLDLSTLLVDLLQSPSGKI